MATAACGACRERKATETLHKFVKGKKTKCRIKVCLTCAKEMVASKKWRY